MELINILNIKYLIVLLITLIAINLFAKNRVQILLIPIAWVGFYLGLLKSSMLLLILGFGYFTGVLLSKITNEEKQIKMFYFVYFFLIFVFIFNELTFDKKVLSGVGLGLIIFQLISWVYDIVFKDYKSDVNVIDYIVYMMFPTKLFIGPIESRVGLFNQIRSKDLNIINKIGIVYPVRLLIMGLFKSIVLSELIISDYEYLNQINNLGLVSNYLFVFLHITKIYLSFSGLTDIIRAISYLLGFELNINFNKPYLSNSFSDYWSRWHISLSQWLEEYFFTPLSFMFRGILGKYSSMVALIFTFILISLWHGKELNYWVFGFLNVVFILVERYFKLDWFKIFKNAFLSKVFFLHMLCMVAMFFSSENIFYMNTKNAFKNLWNIELFNGDIEFVIFSIFLFVLIFFVEKLYNDENYMRAMKLVKNDYYTMFIFLLMVLFWPESNTTLIYLF
jgi:alginate O-acetyltransferase complex protein AlgI